MKVADVMEITYCVLIQLFHISFVINYYEVTAKYKKRWSLLSIYPHVLFPKPPKFDSISLQIPFTPVCLILITSLSYK
jgi:hypothetical protein